MNAKLFLDAYIAAALWSSCDVPLDDNYTPDNLAPATLAAMTADCERFHATYAADLERYCIAMKSEEWTGASRAGHDFWLTRCGHGCGFWDRGLGELGDRLTAAAKTFGDVNLYVGDDGLLYGEG